MKLYEISEEIRALLEGAEKTGEIDHDQLTALEIAFSDKCEAVASVITEIAAESEAYKQEIDRLSIKKRSSDNKIEYLKDYLRTEMTKTGEIKIKGRLFNITLGKPSEIVNITGDVPDKYQVIKVTPDKAAITRALKSGESVQGAELVDGKAKLIIK